MGLRRTVFTHFFLLFCAILLFCFVWPPRVFASSLRRSDGCLLFQICLLAGRVNKGERLSRA